MTALPPYLNAKATKLPEGHDDTLDPAEAPTDAARRTVAPSTWPRVSRALGPLGPPDAPAGPPGVDPLTRSVDPFVWPHPFYLGELVGDLDPDIALWPAVVLNRWPFTGPPTTGVWPLGWLGIDNTATVWICTAGGAPGTWAAIGGPGGQGIAGVYNVKNFGAVGDGIHDDTVAVNEAALAAQHAPSGTLQGQALGGGIVYFPPGEYKVTQQLTYYPSTIWMGAGVTASVLHLTTDLWPGGNALAANFLVPASTGWAHWTVFKLTQLTVCGPSSAPIGQVANKTIGFRSSPQCYLENVRIQSFYAGIESISDHETYIRVASGGNYYGLTFSDAMVTSGNLTFIACNLSSNALASIHISGGGNMVAAECYQVHLGFGPVGIFRTDWQNTTTPWDANGNPQYNGTVSDGTGLISCNFNALVFEGMGNGALIDVATGGQTAVHTTFKNVAHSWASGPFPGPVGTTNPPLDSSDSQRAWMVLAYLMDNQTSWDMNLIAANAGSLGIFKLETSNAPELITRALPANTLGSGSAASGWTAAAFGSWPVILQNSGAVGPWGSCFVFRTTGASVIAVGDLVEINGGTGFVQRATGTRPVFGIAMTPAVSGINCPIVLMTAAGGICLMNTVTTNIVSGGATLYQNGTTPYMVDITTTTGRVVGLAISNGVGTTIQSCVFDPVAK